ncbi:UDP-N-acetylmuramoyl-L-alanine--D-glutamate ligase [Candidatus Microgenomates bacterium]|nr:UDP-N-acetylmuramoyl-L-alanine--D-glutamate ligase [Candidatus Microgenomates bacterium]
MEKFKGKNIAVLGLGVDTQDIVPWLEKQGAKVTVLDEKKGDKFEGLEKFDLIVRSPGVYRFRPELIAAEKAGVEISSKMKIFFDLCPAKIIGVTGTKGKGTTATLIYEILKAAGKKVFLGGNIGTGVFEFLPQLDTDSWVVLELSSFQLVDLTRSPHVAVVLMTTSEHLDWHPTTQDYVDAKKNVVSHQSASDFAVVNQDYPHSMEIGAVALGQVVLVSGKDAASLTTRLRGPHNKENIAATVAVAKIVGVPYEDAVASFAGLEHRLEEVATVKGVTFYNDSFSTTPETAIAAIKAFTEPEIVILGGSSKNSDFKELGRVISTTPNVKEVILIGLEGPRIGQEIHGSVKVVTGGQTMAEIVKLAYNSATSGDVVLLTPACASFDMFKNYKDRGRKFKDQVKALL